jgi:hypothetical protein
MVVETPSDPHLVHNFREAVEAMRKEQSEPSLYDLD